MNTLVVFLICTFLQPNMSFLLDEFSELDNKLTKLFDCFDIWPEQKAEQTRTSQTEQKQQQQQSQQPQQQQHPQPQQHQQQQHIRTGKRPLSIFGEIEKTINDYTNELNNIVIKIEEELGDNILKDAEKIFKLGRPHFLDTNVNNESLVEKLGFNHNEFIGLQKLLSDAVSTWDHFVTTLVKKSDHPI